MDVISNTCHTVTLQPHAAFQTFSLGRKEKSSQQPFRALSCCARIINLSKSIHREEKKKEVITRYMEHDK